MSSAWKSRSRAGARARRARGARAPGSASRAHSGRRRDRSGRAHRDTCRRSASASSRCASPSCAVHSSMVSCVLTAAPPRAPPHEFVDRRRALDARAALRRRSRRRRRTGAPRRWLRRRCARQAAGEDDSVRRASAPRRVPVGSLAAAAHRPFEQHRGRQRHGRSRRAARSTGSTRSVRGRRSAARSSTSVCRMSGLNTRRTSSSQPLRRMARHRDAGAPCRARCGASCAACCGRHLAHRGREHEADGVDCGSSAAVHRLGVVMPQILIHIKRTPDTRAARGAAAVRGAGRRRAPARTPTSARCRPAPGRSRAATRAHRRPSPTPLSATRGTCARQQRRQLVEPPRHHLSVRDRGN